MNLTGIPRGIRVRAHGQLAAARPLDTGEVHRLRKDLQTMAVFLGFTTVSLISQQ